MFYLLSCALILWMVILYQTRGARPALWGGWLIASLLTPSWALLPVGVFILDLRTVAATVGLLGLAWSERMHLRRLLLADVVIVALVLTQIASEYLTGDLGPMGAPELARLWLLPYFVGRFFLSRPGDIRKALPYVCATVLVVSLYGIGEAVVRINPVNSLFGITYGFLEGAEGFRWGLRRAQAFTNHPIYFGYLLVAFLPWVLEAYRQSQHAKGPKWWMGIPVLAIGAILSTGSRGAVLAGVACGCSYFFFRSERWRPALVGVALLLTTLVFTFEEELLHAVTQFGGDAVSTLIIRGEEVSYSGTNHRFLLLHAYEDPLATVGFFGFGSRLQGVDMEQIPPLFYSIDNHYVRFLLQFGYGAVGLFLVLTLVVLTYLAQLAWSRRGIVARLSASLFGVLVGIALLLGSVWFSPDFSAAWLFAAGLAGNLRVLRSGSKLRSDPPAEILELVDSRRSFSIGERPWRM